MNVRDSEEGTRRADGGSALALIHLKARTPTALRLETGQVHELRDVQVVISNWLETDAAGPIHRGLFFDTRAAASTSVDALNLAMRASDGVLSSLSFVAATGAGPLEPLAIFSEALEGCRLRQFIELPLGPGASRVIPAGRLQQVLPAIDELVGDPRERAYTAMSWYRKAALERQPIDAFTAAWLGLETLNALLAQHYGVANEETVRECPKCGEPVITAATSAGIRELLTRFGGRELWQRARRRRVALLHAVRPLAEVHEELPQLARTFANALRRAVLLILDIPEDKLADFEATPMPIPRRHRVRIDVLLPNYRIADVPRGPRYPSMRLHAMPTATRSTDGKQTVENVETQWELVNFPGERYKFSWTIEPDSDPDDAAAAADVRFTGQVPKPGEAPPVESAAVPNMHGQEHPWERAGATREVWLQVLRATTKAYVAAANAVNALFPTDHVVLENFSFDAFRERSEHAERVGQDWRDTINGDGERIRALMEQYNIDERE